MTSRLKTRRPERGRGEPPSEHFLAEGEDLRGGVWPRSFVLWATVFYMALYIIRPWEILFPWLEPFRLERIWALILFVSIVADKRSKFRLDMTTFSMIALIFLVGFSLGAADDISLATQKYWPFVTAIFFAVILKHTMHSLYQVAFIIAMNLLVVAVYLTKSLWEFFVNGQHRFDMYVTRLTGIETTFGGPNALAMTIVVSLPFLYLLYTQRKYIGQRWPQKWQNRFRKCLLYYGFIAVVCVFMTNSRSGLVAMGLFLVLRWARQVGLGSKVKVFFLCVLLLTGLWMVIPQENRDRITTIWNPDSGPKNAQISAQGRVEGFWAGIEMFNDSPLIGIGFGNFVPYRVQNIDGVPLQAHNLLGQTLGETGLLGTGGFCLFLLIVFRSCSNIKRAAKRIALFDREKAAFLTRLSQVYADVFILLLVLGIFGHNFSRYNWYWTAALVSATLYLARTIVREQEISTRRAKRASSL
jgi:hypothetical protein